MAGNTANVSVQCSCYTLAVLLHATATLNADVVAVCCYLGLIESAANDTHAFRCRLCVKDVACGHQGERDLVRHINGKGHLNRLAEKSSVKPLTDRFVKQYSHEDTMARKAEIKFTGFLAEHNLPLSAADHLGSLIRASFPDSKIAQSYSCARTKASCILNDAIAPDLLKSLIADMKINLFSLSVDGSNDQDTEKMNPIAVRIFDINQHKVACKFLDMCLSKDSSAAGIFSCIDLALQKHSIPWTNCLGFGVDNTSVNVGKHNSIMTRVLTINPQVYFMGCPCHMADNAAKHACSAFCKLLPSFDVEDLLVDVFFWFDYSSKRKNAYAEFCAFVDLEYRRTLKFMSVRWLGLTTCLDRVLLQFPALKSYFLSVPDSDKSSKVRLTRLRNFFQDEINEIHCLFLQACLPAFVTFNLFLQREDPIFPLMYEAMIDMLVILLGRVLKPDVMAGFRMQPSKIFAQQVSNVDNQLNNSELFVGFSVRSKIRVLLDDGTISQKQHDDFFHAVRAFHVAGVLYAIKWLPIEDDILKNAGVISLLNKSKFTFNSIVSLVDRFQSYLNFSPTDMNMLESEFALYQCLQLNEISTQAKEEATIRLASVDGNELPVHRLDILWHYIDREFLVAGTQRGKFHNLVRLAKLILTLPHSNADEERVFSRIGKNKTKFRANLSLDRTLPSIITFQMNRPACEPCFRYEPSEEVCKAAKHVTWQYNKLHCSATVDTPSASN